jgi:hypothetical protein
MSAHTALGGEATSDHGALAGGILWRACWREVHLFEVRDGRVAGHWMDAALLSAYLQMTGQGEPDAEPPRPVRSGLARTYTAAEQQAPLDAYTAMVAGHQASDAKNLYTGDYLQHGPFGPNVTREEFEAGNRDIVWKAVPDISIELTPFLARRRARRLPGTGPGNPHRRRAVRHPPGRETRHLHRNPHYPDKREQGLRALAPGRSARPARPAAVLAIPAPLNRPASAAAAARYKARPGHAGLADRPARWPGRSAQPLHQAVSADSHPGRRARRGRSASMAKYAIVVMSEHSEGNPGGQARLLHAPSAARDFADAREEVGIWFHGVDVTWLAAFTARYDQFTSNYTSLFDSVRGNIAGAYDFCARTRFGAAEAAEKLGVRSA